jgi:hypothetical protein
VRVRCKALRFGFTEYRLRIVNLCDPNVILEPFVTLFVDENILHSDLEVIGTQVLRSITFGPHLLTRIDSREVAEVLMKLGVFILIARLPNGLSCAMGRIRVSSIFVAVFLARLRLDVLKRCSAWSMLPIHECSW